MLGRARTEEKPMTKNLRPGPEGLKAHPLDRAAYHEAGRAVARVFCEKAGRIKYTTIRVTEDGLPGNTASYLPANLLSDAEPPRPGTIVDEIKCRLAGMVAVRRRGGHDPSGTGDAWRQASAIAHCHVTQDPEQVHSLVERLGRSTEEPIEENWWAVKAVAKALVERETLTGVEVLSIIADAWVEVERR
jgi:ATP-dependent Zn protease